MAIFVAQNVQPDFYLTKILIRLQNGKDILTLITSIIKKEIII